MEVETSEESNVPSGEVMNDLYQATVILDDDERVVSTRVLDYYPPKLHYGEKLIEWEVVIVREEIE